MKFSKLLGISFAGLLLACGGEKMVVDPGKIVDPDVFPTIVVQKSVNIYIVEWADDECENVSINGAQFEAYVNEFYQTVDAENVSEAAIVEHWQSDNTTSKENAFIYSFMKKHGFSPKASRIKNAFCQAILTEDYENTVIGKMLDVMR